MTYKPFRQILILIFCILLLTTLITPIFSAYNIVYYNSKFDKPITQTHITYFNNQTNKIIPTPTKIYQNSKSQTSQSQNYVQYQYKYEYESKYSDLKQEYRLKNNPNYLESSKYPQTDIDLKKTRQTHLSDREKYKIDSSNQNIYKNELFKQAGYKYHSSEAHARNDY